MKTARCIRKPVGSCVGFAIFAMLLAGCDPRSRQEIDKAFRDAQNEATQKAEKALSDAKQEAMRQTKQMLESVQDRAKQTGEELAKRAADVGQRVKDSVHQPLTNADTNEASLRGARAKLELQTDVMQHPWKQIADIPITSSPANRSASAYAAVIDQFDVQGSHAGRYRPSDESKDTRCNIFAGDVMRAMNAPLPMKFEVDPTNPTDRMTAGAKAINNWLNQGHDGWRKIDMTSATDRAYLLDHVRGGRPALASDPGHIALLRPEQTLSELNDGNLGQLVIAQAGARNYNASTLAFNRTTQSGGWYSSKLSGVQFFVHD